MSYIAVLIQIWIALRQVAVGNDEPELESEDEEPSRNYSRLRRARAAQRPAIVDDHEDDRTDGDYRPSKRGRGGEAEG